MIIFGQDLQHLTPKVGTAFHNLKGLTSRQTNLSKNTKARRAIYSNMIELDKNKLDSLTEIDLHEPNNKFWI